MGNASTQSVLEMWTRSSTMPETVALIPIVSSLSRFFSIKGCISVYSHEGAIQYLYVYNYNLIMSECMMMHYIFVFFLEIIFFPDGNGIWGVSLLYVKCHVIIFDHKQLQHTHYHVPFRTSCGITYCIIYQLIYKIINVISWCSSSLKRRKNN
jgi:hypothetical protein